MLPNPQKTVDLVTFTGEILNGKLLFLCSVGKVGRDRSHKKFLIEHLVHELLTIVTRLFVSFIKIPVLLQISVLKNLYPVRV